MALVMTSLTLLVSVLCLPLHVMHAVGLHEIYKRVFPFCWSRISKTYYNKKMHDEKKELFRSLLEFIRPDGQKYLEKSINENNHLACERFVVASGEDMRSVGDGSVDVVVCTLVLCSVRDAPQTLREVHRILRPGGAFLFLEHVIADPSTWTYFFQHVLQPAWYYFGDGCEVTRDTWKHLEAAGFSELKLRHIEAPLLFLIKPHIVGYAVK
ncbi:thiol S-methyltransferase TMT1A-like isoform X2 [Trachinotus anak]|uniref:thiol S-methyltransferase TMT1A-like isoform X2 n=1 Tax=Trachinotus anak TaxID=443729 RepID=UPI0039F1FE40